MKMSTLKWIITMLAFTGSIAMASAQSPLVRWNGGSSTLNATLLASHISAANISNHGGGSLSNNGQWNQFFFANSWPSGAINTARYIQFAITAGEGFKIDAQSFNFEAATDGGNASYEVRYSKDFSIGYASSTGTLNGTWSAKSINLSSMPAIMPGETLYIRFHLHSTWNSLRIKHNWGGTTGPTLIGTVSPAVTGNPADLGITLSMDNMAPEAGAYSNVTINVDNHSGAEATGAQAALSLPAGFAYVSHSSSVGTYNGTTGVWNLGAIEGHSSAQIQVTLQALSSGPYTLNASVSHFGSDAVNSNNTVSLTPSNACSDCTKTVSGSLLTVNAGEVYCLHSGTWSGGLVMNGGVICIGGGATFNTSYITGTLSGTIINRGTVHMNLNNNVNHPLNIENHGTFTSSHFQQYGGNLVNHGRFTMTAGNFQTIPGAVITNHGKMKLLKVDAQNTTFTNHDSLVAENNFYALGSSSSIDNKPSGVILLNMNEGGNAEIRGTLQNAGLMHIRNAVSDKGIAATVNNTGDMKFYNSVILNTNTYFTNDNLVEFINIRSVEFQGPMLQNNGRIHVTHGNLSMHSATSEMVNDGTTIVSGTVFHGMTGSKITNNCRLVSKSYFIGNGETINNGLIWVMDTFQLEGLPSVFYQSNTGSVRGKDFRNSGDISGYGSYHFTGYTNFISEGSFIGSSADTPIMFFDTTPDGEIFDDLAISAGLLNVIRPGLMTPADTTSSNCSGVPIFEDNYPPLVVDFTKLVCNKDPLTILSGELMEPHPAISPGAPFTLLFATIKLFEFGNPDNAGNNSTILSIEDKGTFSVNITNGNIIFTPDPEFVSGSAIIEYRISNSRAGDSKVYPSSKKKITINMGLGSIVVPPIQVGTF